MLPVRFYLDNSDPSSWRLDVSHQKVKFPGISREVVARISDKPSQTPVSEVPKGESRVWEIVFPVPDSIKTSTDIAEFDLNWEILTQSRPVAGTVSFVRAVLPDKTDYGSNVQTKKNARH